MRVKRIEGMGVRVKGLNLNKLWMALGLTAGLLASGFGQLQNYPAYGSGSSRVGHNLSPGTDNPGQSFLTWFFPQAAAANSTVILRNNTSSEASQTAGWTAPPSAVVASGYFNAVPTGVPATDALVGTATNPPYEMSFATPSALGSDPTVPAAGLPTYFQWQITPGSATPADYALYGWIPQGATLTGTGSYYAPRYFVYEIDYGTGQKFIDVVDRTVAGSGFFRLGAGGAATNLLFHYDGVTPIRIKLYNTIPRDSNGNLIGVRLDASGNPANQYLLYADAVEAVPNYGEFDAAPVIATDVTTTLFPMRIFAAYNNSITSQENGATVVEKEGTLSSLGYSPGKAGKVGRILNSWSFSPIAIGAGNVTLDSPNAGVTVQPGWTKVLTPATNPYNLGADYYIAPVTNNAAAAVQSTYSPTLPDGTYDVYVWLPGVQTQGYAKNVEVDVYEGATKTAIIVDLTQENGYLHIGSRKFANTKINPLTVQISNFDSVAADAGKFAYADAVKFVGAANLAITSTPVYATVPIAIGQGNGNPPVIVNKQVVIVCAEDGRIYCCDVTGRGDGTTDVYWAYPSLPSTTADPNANGPDGTNNTILAQMPTGFGKTSPLIAEVPPGSGHFQVYVGSTNGRVYSIDCTGRGDNNLSLRQPGTTTRMWSYPNDYPATPVSSNLGSFTGSLAFHLNAAGPTIFAPTTQGRMYALDAGGNSATKTTTVRWAYPAITSPALGPIASTPAIDGTPGAVYFGTEMADGVQPGQFFSLNAETGAVNWSYTQPNFLSFDGGPATAFNNLVGDGQNYIFAANKNGYVYAFNDAGAILWSTNELQATIDQPLTFTNQIVYDNTGALTTSAVPTVVVPTNGTFNSLFAAQATTNISGGRLAWFYYTDGDQVLAPMAAAQGYLIGADNHGYMYAYSNTATNFTGSFVPGGEGITPNNPISIEFRNSKIAFLTPAAYAALIADPNPSYATYTAASNFLSQNAFDFGETVYAIVYNFPYDQGGSSPTTVNFKAITNGSLTRTVSVESQQFAGAPANEDGFALLNFPLEPSGNNSLAPGSGSVAYTASIQGTNGIQAVVNPGVNRTFIIANPLGIALDPDSTNPIYGELNESLGATAASFPDPSNPENVFNGAVIQSAVAGLTVDPTQLIESAGLIPNGQSGSSTIAVYDRSLMAVLNGPDVGGINEVRVEPNYLAWQGGYDSVIKPIGGANGLYPGNALLDTFEMYPVNFPNDSLDYPDIAQDHITVTANPDTQPQNPIFSGVSLNIPNGLFLVDANGNMTNNLVPQAKWRGRTPVPTPFEFDVNVPQFQPANLVSQQDTVNQTIRAGYKGRMNVYVDSNNSGRLDSTSTARDAYRTFLLGSGVDVQEAMEVLTPNLDLGSLPGGAATGPGVGISSTNVYSPWAASSLSSIYGSFSALNTGNTNLLNVRLAHAQNNGASYQGWPFFSSGNDDLGFVDGSAFMWSDLDPVFSPSAQAGVLPRGEVFVPKARVQDRTGSQILTNPVSRITGNALAPGFPSQNPRLTITPPIGFPVGQYNQIVRLIEDRNYLSPNPTQAPGYDLSLDLNSEPFSDPTLDVSFTVTETRLTNSNTARFDSSGGLTTIVNSPMLESLVPPGASVTGQVDSNIEPTASRDLFGGLTSVWSSNRLATNIGTLPGTVNSSYRLLIGSLAGATQQTAAESKSPLRDLGAFTGASGAAWFGLSGQYPFGSTSANAAQAATLFQIGAGDHVVGANGGETDSVRFGKPSLPNTGQVDPFDEAQAFASEVMAFTGSALDQTPTGQKSVNGLFAATLTPVNGAAPTVSGATGLILNGQGTIGKPSVVQVGTNNAVIFFSTSGTGADRIHGVDFSGGAFGQESVIDLGSGFESASDPSGIARVYTGADANVIAQNGKLIDFAFSGKLRGRANKEIFFGRIPCDANGVPDASNAEKSFFSYFSPEVDRLEATGANGTFRTQGVQWNPQGPLILTIGTQVVDVIATGAQDSDSGIWTVQTQLGRVYLDPNVGTVRFVGAIPGQTANLTLENEPKFVRISSGTTSGLTATNLVWDNHLVGAYSGSLSDRFWFTGVNGSTPAQSDLRVRSSRWVVVYDRSGAGTGQSARPMMETLRLGVPVAIPILANGAPDFTKLQVTALGPYQVDPKAGMIYFTTADEGQLVTITANGNTVQVAPSMVIEKSETPVPIDSPASEGQVTAFLDPFDPNQNFADRRPDMVWLFWSSSRNGAQDVYFESVAPAFYPIVTTH